MSSTQKLNLDWFRDIIPVQLFTNNLTKISVPWTRNLYENRAQTESTVSTLFLNPED